MRYLMMFVLLSAGLVVPVWAGEASEPCSAPEFRQFDFWLGDWNVFNPEGELVGENRVTLDQGQCVLHEHWRGKQGGTGESFNMYDARRGVWHQTWVAASGNLLLLDGGLQDGSMVLSGEQPAGNGDGKIMNQISWTLQEDGAVEQKWEQSLDGGESWKVVFVGIYRSKE